MSWVSTFKKQLLSTMDHLVASIVKEIGQFDIFDLKHLNGNPEGDIQMMNLTATIRKITSSTTEQICRIFHKALTGPKKDLDNRIKRSTKKTKKHSVAQKRGRPLKTRYPEVKEEEPAEGGSQQDFPSDDLSGSKEYLNHATSDQAEDGGVLLQTVEKEPEFQFEPESSHEEEQIESLPHTPAVNESVELNAKQEYIIDHQGEEKCSTEQNTVESIVQCADGTVPQMNIETMGISNIIETRLDEEPTKVYMETKNEQKLNTHGTCGKTFTYLNNLRRHQQKHSGDTPLACQECGECFVSRRLLQIHRRVHKVEKPHKCTLCEKTFRLPNHLRNHMITHGNERPFTCSTCGKSFTLLSILRAHERTHSGEKKFVCSQCGSRFLTKSYLDCHQRVHTGEKPYTCKHCGKSFSQKSNLTAHERLHTGEQPFRCEDCGKSFVHANTLKSHRQLHTGVKAFCCELCGKGFRRGTHLKTHLLTHSANKPFSCDVCGKTFCSKGSLKTHKLTHTGEKSFVCTLCNKHFTQASSLGKHRRIHTGEKPYRCENCEKCFSQRSHLNYHSKGCHFRTKR